MQLISDEALHTRCLIATRPSLPSTCARGSDRSAQHDFKALPHE